MKIHRGVASAARHYVEAVRSRGDDYYLAEGSSVAMRIAGSFDNLNQQMSVEHRPAVNGETYEQWSAGSTSRPAQREGD